MAVLGGAAIEVGGGGRIDGHAQAALGDHAEQIERGGQVGFGGLAQLLDDERLGFGIGAFPRHGQRVAQVALRAAGLGRLLVPAAGFVRVAQVLGPGGQDEAEQGLAVGGAALGGAARPFLGRGEVGRHGGVGREQAGGGAGRTGCIVGQSVHEQRREQSLGFDIALVGGALQPTSALAAAGRDADGFQVAAADAELGLGDAGGRCPHQQRKRPLALTLLGQAHAALQCRLGRKLRDQAIHHGHWIRSAGCGPRGAEKWDKYTDTPSPCGRRAVGGVRAARPPPPAPSHKVRGCY